MHRKYYILYLLFLVCAFTACTPRSIREAQEVVAQADGLWHEGRMYGVDEGDSATLAQAYKTLGQWQWFYADEYAHACYHYGRILREKEHPVEAMECFINATYSHTRDYHILGRVYSNMGDIAHLAGEFPLAYDMYERSGQMYLRNGDSLLYYYDLNNMAFELAENQEYESALNLLDHIKQNCKYLSVIEKTNETRIILFKHTHQYDSILYYFDSVPSYVNNEPLVLISKAQAFCYLQQYDSATYYAYCTVQGTNDLFNLNNAYYILIHCDSINNAKKVYSLSADRSDVQKQLEIRQGKLSRAVQLLEQDLHCKPNLTWLYAICATLIIVGLVVFIYVHKKRRQRALLSQQVNALEEQHEQIVQEHSEYTNKLMAQVAETCTLLSQSPHLSKDLCWNDFESMCHFVDQQLFMIASKLRQKQMLNETEVRLCILVLLDLSRKQISETLPYSLNSVGKLKDHTAKLLGTTGKNLHDFLLNMAVEG